MINEADRGRIRNISAEQPAAGSAVNYAVPAGVVWQLEIVHFSFTTDGAVANRYPVVTLQLPGAVSFWKASAAVAQVASKTHVYSAGRGAPASQVADSESLTIPLPTFDLVEGDVIRVSVVNMQPADQLSALRLRVREWSL